MECFSRLIEKSSNYLYELEKTQQKRTAIIYMIIAQFCFSTMYTIIGVLRKDYSTLQILFIRMVIGYNLNNSFCSIKNLNIYIDSGKALRLLVLRGAFGALGMILMFISLSTLNISDAVVIQNLSPIWTNILAIFFLGENFSKKTLICFIFGFGGIIFLSRPDFLFHESTSEANKGQAQFIGSIYGITGSISVAFITITLKKLTTVYKCHNIVQQQYSYLVTLTTSALLLIFFNQAAYEILNLRFLSLCFIIALIGWIGQLLFSRAYGLEKTSIIAPITYIQTFLTFMIDLFLFDSHIQLTSIIGSILIVIGSLGVIL